MTNPIEQLAALARRLEASAVRTQGDHDIPASSVFAQEAVELHTILAGMGESWVMVADPDEIGRLGHGQLMCESEGSEEIGDYRYLVIELGPCDINPQPLFP